MKLAITGASGYIGAHVVDKALERGYQVRILVRKDCNREDWKNKGVEMFIGDMLDKPSLEKFLAGADALIHCAAINKPTSKQRKAIFANNVEGMKLTLRTAHEQGVKKIVYTGSTAALGCKGKGMMNDEDTEFNLWNASTDYEKSKYLGEKAAMELYQNEGIPVAIAEPAGCVGPGDVKPTYTGELIIDVINGKVPGYFNMRHNFVDVRSVAEGHLLVLEKGNIGERYLLCGNDNILMSDYFKIICDIVGKKPPRLMLPLWMVFPMAWGFKLLWKLTGIEPFIRLSTVKRAKLDLHYDNSKAKRILGYNPAPLKDALRDEIKWFIDNGYLTNITLKA